jgi:hypothetical protein
MPLGWLQAKQAAKQGWQGIACAAPHMLAALDWLLCNEYVGHGAARLTAGGAILVLEHRQQDLLSVTRAF